MRCNLSVCGGGVWCGDEEWCGVVWCTVMGWGPSMCCGVVMVKNSVVWCTVMKWGPIVCVLWYGDGEEWCGLVYCYEVGSKCVCVVVCCGMVW